MKNVTLGFIHDPFTPNLSEHERLEAFNRGHWQGVEAKCIVDLKPNEKYIFYVGSLLPNFFLHDLPALPAPVQEDVARGRAIVLFFQPYEGGRQLGCARDDYSVIEDWIDRSHIDPQLVHFIHGNLKPYPTRFHLHQIQAFEPWLWGFGTHPPARYSGRKLFLNYNRAPRDHRIRFVAELLRTKLIEEGLVSFNPSAMTMQLAGVYHDSIKPHVQYLSNNRLLLDADTPENLALTVHSHHYRDTLFSVVSETLVQSGTLFISEKTWKSIQVGHPFMVYGNPGTLAYLRDLGFNTFDDFFDTRYDNDIDTEQRMYLILAELKRLSTLTQAKRLQLAEQMRPVCEFNQAQFRRHVHKKYGNAVESTAPFLRPMKQIWSALCA